MISRKFDPAIRKRLAVGLLLVAALLLFLTAIGYLRSGSIAKKPHIGLMTTLPLRWAEGNLTTALDPNIKPSGAYNRLAEQYKIDLVDNFNTLKSNNPAVLILAQPRALAPQELVQLDAWVRKGGRLLVFADPALAWESAYPLGDKRRPLFTSLLSPLFGHWGLDLVLPMNASKASEIRRIDAFSVRMPTPGAWQKRGDAVDSACRISSDYILADCKVGEGRAILVADADLLDQLQWQGTGARLLTGSDDFANMQWMMSLIERLRARGLYRETMGGSE
jgi:ABC-type uncharacterized transport system